MKVLALDQFSEPGGAQQALAELVPPMRARGWTLATALPGSGELFEYFENSGVPTRAIACGPYTSGRKSVADVGRFLLQTPALSGQIARLVREFRPDLLYLNGPRLLPAAALSNLRIPTVFHSHSYLGSNALRRLAGAGLRHSKARVIACCEFVARPWRAFTGGNGVAVIYNGVAGPPGSAAKKARGQGPIIGCIGRIAPEKGQREFLRAAERIHRAIPECRFLICGAPLFSPDALRYEAALHEAATGLPVEFRGWTKDIYTALAEVDLLLLPSLAHEASPRVILEAFSAGVPVIARPSGGIPEVIDHGVNGLLAGSEEEMAGWSIELLTGPSARRKVISEHARKSWSRRFTLHHYHRQVLDFLENCAWA